VVIYMAAPVGARDPETIDSNLERARRWLRWLVASVPWAVSVPWMPYVETFDETPANRERGLRDDLTMLERCDAIVLCGGRVSAGMAMERDHAHRHGLRIISLVDLGEEPPRKPDGALLQRRLDEAA